MKTLKDERYVVKCTVSEIFLYWHVLRVRRIPPYIAIESTDSMMNNAIAPSITCLITP